ncbi:MAG: hypothetical protein R3258_05115 [Acidimicrobiia bacterium]|nr:hypothetical protein [Acidimicrobiia bacterium]
MAPTVFYELVALFEPYNGHFVQDIGAFQIGLGVTLLLAVFTSGDALTVALLGVGVGAAAHVVSHLVGLDAGGNPVLDIPSLGLLGVLLLVAGLLRRRQPRAG